MRRSWRRSCKGSDDQRKAEEAQRAQTAAIDKITTTSNLHGRLLLAIQQTLLEVHPETFERAWNAVEVGSND